MEKTEKEIKKIFDEASEIANNIVEETETQETETQETETQETETQETETQETETQETETQETETQETETQETETQETETQETETQETNNGSNPLFDDICQMLEKANRYSHISCGCLIKNELTEKSVKEFYEEFKKWGNLTQKEDFELIEKLEQYYNNKH